MKKVKKMALGGMGKQPANALRQMPAATPKPVPAFARPYADKMMSAARTQSQMQAAESAAQQAAPKQMQFMSDKLRAAQTAQQQAMQKGGAKFAPDSGYIQQLKQMTPSQRQQAMTINAAKNAAETQRVNQFNAMTPAQRQQAEIARTSGTIGQLSQMSPSGRQQAMTINAAKNAMETLRGNQLNAMTPVQRQQAEIARTSGTIGGTAARALGLGMKKGGAVKSSASKRGDGIAQRGKTKGRMV